MTKHLYPILLSLLFVAVVSCNKSESGRNPCLEPRKYFLRLQSNLPADTGSLGTPTDLPSPVIGYVDTNILFANGSAAGNTFTGALSTIVDSTRWFIQPDTSFPAAVDTVTFYYDRKPVFLSTACGYTFVFALKDVKSTNNDIDSVRIENSEIAGDAEAINVKVFY